MVSFFGSIGHGIEHLGQQVGNEAKKFISGDPKPDPRQFSNGASVPSPSSPGVPGIPGQTTSGYTNFGSSPSLPIGGDYAPPGLSQQQATQFQNAVAQNPDLAGVISTLGGWGKDAWDWVTQALPHNADGSVDWGKVGGDIAGWVKDNAKTLVSAASAYEQYQRQGKADQYAQQGLAAAQQSYDAKAPLRSAGMAGMLNPSANTPNLASLGAQGQQGQTLQASLPIANPAQSQGLANLRSLAGANSGNPFGKSLTIASAPMGPSANIPLPSLPVGIQNPISSRPEKPGQADPNSPFGTIPASAWPQTGLPPVGPGGAPTTVNTRASYDPKTGSYGAQGVSPTRTITQPPQPPKIALPSLPIASS